MAGWDDCAGATHYEAEASRVTLPLAKAMCAHCDRRRLVSEMVIETNTRSGACGFLVCNEPHQQGGCFEGPYPDLEKPAKADNMGPIENIFY